MTWEWSYSQEGLSEIYDAIYDLDRDTLEIIFAEIKSTSYQNDEEEETNNPQFDETSYQKHLSNSHNLSGDVLADFIWDHARKQSECSNGGHEVYLCPYHCHSINLS